MINLKVPVIVEPDTWNQWEYSQLYIYTEADSGRYVPNEGDLVENVRERTSWIVDYRNPLPPFDFTLEPYVRAAYANTDVIEGDRSPVSRDAFRVLINKDRVPATLNMMSQWTTKGSANRYIRVFLGSRIGEAGVCISGHMLNGKMVDNTIPLELAYAGNTDIKTLKHPIPGICTQIPQNGDVVTVVVYNAVDEITEQSVCSVILTDMAMTINRPQRRIVDVRLKSPQLSTSNDHQLELPINTPIADIMMTCEVHYTTGKVEYNIDGVKAKLIGLTSSGAYDEMFISSMLGKEIPIQLSYTMSDEETYIGDDIVDRTINRQYSAITERVDGSYSPKLFVVPTWAGTQQGYRLDYYLTDLRRNGIYKATDKVRYGENSPAIDPLLYGIKQKVSVRVNTAEVSPTFKDHYHTEVFTITFTAPGTEKRDNFIIEYIPASPTYGDQLWAEFEPYNLTFNKINVTCGKASLTEWLNALYYPVYPVYDPKAEAGKAPMPTHFELIINDRGYRHPITDWLQLMVVDTGVVDGQHLRLHWIYETPTDDLYLGVSSLLMHEKN